MEIELITTGNTYQRPRTDSKTLLRDLKLDPLLAVMAEEDTELLRICRQMLLQPSTRKKEIMKRQTVLQDGITHTELFHTIYQSALEALKRIKAFDVNASQKYNYVIPVPQKILSQAEIAFTALEYLEKIRGSIRKEDNFTSEAFSSFCGEFTAYYTESFIREVRTLLHSLTVLKKTDAISIGIHLGKGLKMTDLTLHRFLSDESPAEEKKRVLPFIHKAEGSYEIKIENTTIENKVREMVDASLTWILKTISDFNHSAIHLLEQLKFQFGFYCGGINLYKYLSERKINICFPEFADTQKVLMTSGLSDLFLVIKDNSATTNSISYKDKHNWIITGVNQGGKTTFLRSIGTAQLLAQSGYFAAAGQYVCNIYQSIFTHFPEDEDTSLKHGLLEQELLKMQDIIEGIVPDSLLLLNETFSTTTDYDGAYLAKELLQGIGESGITCFYVTHNYEFSHSLYLEGRAENVFLRADREADGRRSFRLSEGGPVKTGYALDLYTEVMHDTSHKYSQII